MTIILIITLDFYEFTLLKTHYVLEFLSGLVNSTSNELVKLVYNLYLTIVNFRHTLIEVSLSRCRIGSQKGFKNCHSSLENWT